MGPHDYAKSRASHEHNFPVTITQQSYKAKNTKSHIDLTQTHSVSKLPELVRDSSELYSQLDLRSKGRESIKVPKLSLSSTRNRVSSKSVESNNDLESHMEARMQYSGMKVDKAQLNT